LSGLPVRFVFNDRPAERPRSAIGASFTKNCGNCGEPSRVNDGFGVINEGGCARWDRVEYYKRWHSCRFDELGRPADRIQINEAGPTRYQDQIGGLCSRQGLRACGWRRVDNGDGETVCGCGGKPVWEPALRQKLDMGKLILATICPYDGALLRV
jgi:hypothetical protein